jgi:hypothetical protein
MGSRALITTLIAVCFFVGAVGFLALRPLSPNSPQGEVARSAAQFLKEQEPVKKIVRTGRIRNHRSNILGLMNFSTESSRRSDSGLLGERLDRKLNQLPDLGMDQKLFEKYGNAPEVRFIRFGIALQMNDFSQMTNEEDRQSMEVEYTSRLRSAGVGVFQMMQAMALEGLTEEKFSAERAAVHRLLADAAVENDFARMMIQDLVLRESYRNPNQDFSRVAERYEIDPNHPLYLVLKSSFNRAPASVGAK